MEIPFKYIMLCIIRTLNERGMPLSLTRNTIRKYLSKLMEKSYFTIEEKKQMGEDFDFEYELSSLFDKYFEYFDNDGDIISYDEKNIEELGELILEEFEDYDEELISNFDVVIEGDTEFLDILGVPIKKELYNYLLDIEKELEEAYNEFCRLDSYVGLSEVDIKPLIKKITSLKMKKVIMLVNTKNLLSYYEHHDLMQYSINTMNRTDDFDEINLLISDGTFDETDILDDILLKSIFTGGELYISCISESIMQNVLGISDNIKNSTIKFYLTFLNLLDKEIKNSNELLSEELNRVKYRLIYSLDSVYDTFIVANKDFIYDEYEENYNFINKTVKYFIDELLMYDDEQYRNKDCDTDNTMIYLDNVVKKLLIESYYKLTNDKDIINMIKENELYGVNNISSGFLKELVEKTKTKIKGV